MSLELFVSTILLFAVAPEKLAGQQAPALTPPPFPAAQAADAWLNKARSSLGQILDAPNATVNQTDLELAISLVRARGNPDDRALLHHLLIAHPAPKPNGVAGANWEFLTSLSRASALSAVNDTNAARSILFQLEIELNEEKLRLPYLSPECFLAVGWANLGELNKVLELLAVTSEFDRDLPYELAVIALHDGGFAAQRDALLQRRLDRAKRLSDPSDRAWALLAVARSQRQVGGFAGARQTIGLVPQEHFRCEALRDLACAEQDSGDEQSAVGDLSESLRVALRLKERSADEAMIVAETACAIGMPKVADEALAAAETAANTTGCAEVSFWPKLARVAAARGQRARFKRLIDIASASVSDDADPRAQARMWMLIAAAHARAGDRNASVSALDRSLSSAREMDYARNDAFAAFCQAWVDAGRGEVALELAQPLVRSPQELSYLHDAIATYNAKLGRFEQAWIAADQINLHPQLRLGALCRVAMLQSKSTDGNPDALNALAARVDRLQNPRDRATVSLAVAQRLKGQILTGPLRALDSE